MDFKKLGESSRFPQKSLVFMTFLVAALKVNILVLEWVATEKIGLPGLNQFVKRIDRPNKAELVLGRSAGQKPKFMKGVRTVMIPEWR